VELRAFLDDHATTLHIALGYGYQATDGGPA